MGLFLPFFYLPSYAVAHGMSHELASYIVGILNAASFFGRVIPGVLGDKWGRLNILFSAGLGTAILIFCFTLMKTNATIIVRIPSGDSRLLQELTYSTSSSPHCTVLFREQSSQV